MNPVGSPSDELVDGLAPPTPPGDGVPPVGPVKSPRRAAFELLIGAVAVVALFVMTGSGDLLIVIACLIVMIMVHELGHLLAAKRGGMKVSEYFLGFGPRIWSVRVGETEYGVKALPLGGYVKIPGMTNLEDVDPADEARTYRQQPFRYRLLVAVAGSAMHFLMAFILLWTLLTFVGVPSPNQIEVAGVAPIAGMRSPASVAGIHAGDVIVSIDGKSIGGNATALTAAIRDHVGVPLTVVVDRGGHRRILTVTPANGRAFHEPGVSPPAGSSPYGIIGVSLGQPTVRTNPFQSVGTSVVDVGHFTAASVVGVVHLFSPSGIAARFHQVVSARAANQAAANGTRVQSIVGAVRIADQAAHAGIGQLLAVLISINLFVGVFNLFPMLPLDGGHVIVAVYEKFRTGRRRILYHADVARLMPFTWLMLGFLAILFATTLTVDLTHPMSNPFG